MNGIPFPAIDPVIFHLGPFAVRWYAVAYLVGFVAGWRYCIHLSRVAPVGPSPQDMDDFLTWAVVGTCFGGRSGSVLVYIPVVSFLNHLEYPQVWGYRKSVW